MVTTIKWEIVKSLDDLTQTDLDTFCHRLRDRREEPRVRRRAVDGKTILEVADLLVSTFTEHTALQVTLDILKQINCNEEAKALESRTKACVDKGDPTLPRTSNGELETRPSQEARNHVVVRGPLQAAQPVMAKSPQEVEAEAKALVRSEGGDLCNDWLVLSRFMIQFGQYKGKTFKWLLENDVGYAVYLVADHQKEREGKGTMRQDPLMANKDSLTRYVSHYPEVLEEVRFKRAYEKAEEGKALAGFGKYPSEKLQDLYESKEPRKVSYVDFLRTMKSTCNPGSKMEVAVAYVLHRDKHWGTAPGKRPIKRKQVQSTRGQPTSVSWPIRKKPKYNWKRT
ncbi:uncharacterized protein LOC127366634 [Dicentrarchus labrax]|uniref:uncharacterized protein LOC127366634 n=1 Tax=Dicentrarchus labrax TaxID=13489 RepID=UPI0021F5732B|nr:uncharacterized protein LOC127366634 [Dicentrarchus labrax]